MREPRGGHRSMRERKVVIGGEPMSVACDELTRVTPPLIPVSFSGAIAAIMDLMKTAAAGLTLAEYWVRTTSNPSPHHHTPTTESCHQASASATRNTPKLLPHRHPSSPPSSSPPWYRNCCGKYPTLAISASLRAQVRRSAARSFSIAEQTPTRRYV